MCQLSEVADSLAKTMHRHMAREEAGGVGSRLPDVGWQAGRTGAAPWWANWSGGARRVRRTGPLLPSRCCSCWAALPHFLLHTHTRVCAAHPASTPPRHQRQRHPSAALPAEVLPILTRSVCMAQQRHMVWRILRAMPLRLLERVMPWVAGEAGGQLRGSCMKLRGSCKLLRQRAVPRAPHRAGRPPPPPLLPCCSQAAPAAQATAARVREHGIACLLPACPPTYLPVPARLPLQGGCVRRMCGNGWPTSGRRRRATRRRWWSCSARWAAAGVVWRGVWCAVCCAVLCCAACGVWVVRGWTCSLQRGWGWAAAGVVAAGGVEAWAAGPGACCPPAICWRASTAALALHAPCALHSPQAHPASPLPWRAPLAARSGLGAAS